MMKIKKTGSVICAVTMAFCALLLISSAAVAAPENDNVTEEDAIIASIGHVVSVVNAEDGSSDDANWSNGVDVRKTTVLYGTDEKPSAYLIELERLDGAEAGYIIVGADKSEAPILGFAFDGEHMYHEAITDMGANENEVKLYYAGNETYFAKAGNELQTLHLQNRER